MPRTPAPIHELKVKLRSATPDVREIALLHAQAHGPAGASLAAEVARLLEDESPAIQLQAVHTFRAIGKGAADAVPLLMSLRSKAADSPMLAVRATILLGVVGTAAGAAVPALKQDLATRRLVREVLGALTAIAPGDPEVGSALVDAALGSDFVLSLYAREAVKTAPPGLIDRLVDAVILHATGDDPQKRVRALGLAATLAEHRPSVLTPVILQALARSGTEGLVSAVHAAGSLPKPLPAAIFDALESVARSDDQAAEEALTVLAALPESRQRLQGLFLETLRKHREALPVGGPKGGPARSLAIAATALTPASGQQAVPELLEWLDRALRTVKPRFKFSPGDAVRWFKASVQRPRPGLSWYTVAHVTEALARFAPGSEEVHAAIRDAAEVAFSCRDDDESGVLDFERALRRIATAIGDGGLWADLVDAGLAQHESEESWDGSEASQRPLPDFPPETGPEPKPTSRPLTPRERNDLDQAMAVGRTLVGVIPSDEPTRVAEAVEQRVRNARRELGVGDQELLPLGALFGEAVARETGWSWEMFALGGTEQLALVSETRAHAHLPVAYLAGQRRGGGEPTMLLLFNLLAGGNLPPSKPGALSVIG